MVSNKIRKEIKFLIENFEYKHSGAKYVNGGYVLLKKFEIDDERGYYYVTANVVIGNLEQETTYLNCEYYLDKKDLHLLSKDELAELEVKELEAIQNGTRPRI